MFNIEISDKDSLGNRIKNLVTAFTRQKHLKFIQNIKFDVDSKSTLSKCTFEFLNVLINMNRECLIKYLDQDKNLLREEICEIEIRSEVNDDSFIPYFKFYKDKVLLSKVTNFHFEVDAANEKTSMPIITIIE